MSCIFTCSKAVQSQQLPCAEMGPVSVVRGAACPFPVVFRLSTSSPQASDTRETLKKTFGKCSGNISGTERLFVSRVIPKQMLPLCQCADNKISLGFFSFLSFGFFVWFGFFVFVSRVSQGRARSVFPVVGKAPWANQNWVTRWCL